jgi:hypothetical protein
MKQIVVTGATRSFSLLTYNREWRVLREEHFSSLEELAQNARINSWAVERNRETFMVSLRKPVYQKAFTDRGDSLPIDDLVAWGDRLAAQKYARRDGLFQWRRGPVPGVRRHVCGHYFRVFSNHRERKQNAGVIVEEGEVWPRARRRANNLINDRDDIYSHKERNWKSQHKGIKAWDHPKRSAKKTQ